MKPWIVSIFLAMSLFAIPANAFSGAEFKESERNFATGYVLGVVEFSLVAFVGESEMNTKKQKRQDCLIQGKISADIIYDAIKNYLNTKPELLSLPAYIAITETALKICP